MSCCTKSAERRAGLTYNASVKNNGDATYEATTRHSTFLMGTEGHGANPIDTLLASLCACIGHYARDYLKNANIAAAGFTVKAGAAATPDGARLAAIDVRIDVDGDLDARQRSELLRTAEHCKIHNTLKACCDIRLTVEPRTTPGAGATSEERSLRCP